MAPEKLAAIIEKIDAAVGPPECETVEERQKRQEMIGRDARRREVRKRSG